MVYECMFVLHFSVKKLVFRDLFMTYTPLSISDYRETGRLKKSGCGNHVQPDCEFSCYFMLTFFVVVFLITVSENAFFSSFTSMFSK